MKHSDRVRLLHRAGTGFAACLLVLAASTAGAGTAWAAGPDGPDSPSNGPIDTTTTTPGSITIHDYQNQNSVSVTGNPLGSVDTSGLTPIQGASFTAYQITSLHLDTSQATTASSGDWAAASSLAGSVQANACTSGAKSTPSIASQTLSGTGTTPVSTDSSGQATIPSLAVGAYLVCENPPSSTVTSASTSGVVENAQPFIVTVPFPDVTNSTTPSGVTPSNKWVYAVNVYPKNGVATISQTVVSQSLPTSAVLGLGSANTASFAVTTTIPAISPTNTSTVSFDHYAVLDPLDPRINSQQQVQSVTINGSTVPAADYTSSSAGTGNAYISFTPVGLNYLKGQPGASLVTTFTGTVGLLGSGAITNNAYLDMSTDPSSTPPSTQYSPTFSPLSTDEIEAPSVTQNWGELKLQSVDQASSSTGLPGAQLELLPATNPAAPSCTGATAASGATAIPVGSTGQTVFTSDTNGNVDIPGLYVSDTTSSPAQTQRCYVVRETSAPVGYMLPSSDTGVAVTTGSASTTFPIPNSKEAIPGLPLTGAQGTLLLSLVGGGLMLVGGGVTVAERRHHRRAA